MARLEYYYLQAHMYLAHAILELVHLVRPPLHCSTPGTPLPLPLALLSLPGGWRQLHWEQAHPCSRMHLGPAQRPASSSCWCAQPVLAEACRRRMLQLFTKAMATLQREPVSARP